MSTMPPVSTTPSGCAFPSRRITLIILSILTLPSIIGLIVAIFFSLVSPLVFDAPGSTEDTSAWITFYIFCTSPILFIIGIFGGWLSFFLKRHRLALILMSLPLLEICVFLFGILFVEGF